MDLDLSRCLHILTARADRAADHFLRTERGVSYSRFLVLHTLHRLGSTTQRELAGELSVTEPAVSRMVRTLAGDGLLTVSADPAGGNRRCVALTPTGQRIVIDCGKLLEGRFAALVNAAGVSYADYHNATQRLLAALDTDRQYDGAARSAAG